MRIVVRLNVMIRHARVMRCSRSMMMFIKHSKLNRSDSSDENVKDLNALFVFSCTLMFNKTFKAQ